MVSKRGGEIDRLVTATRRVPKSCRPDRLSVDANARKFSSNEVALKFFVDSITSRDCCNAWQVLWVSISFWIKVWMSQFRSSWKK